MCDNKKLLGSETAKGGFRNEEEVINQLLERLPYHDRAEIIIADGQSSDRTAELARKYPVKVIQTSKNRASQMNEGAKIARGDTLLFLHADCLLEETSLKAIEHSLNDGNVGGCLTQRINSNRLIY